MTIIIGYFILAYIDYDACRERLLGRHYLQITTIKLLIGEVLLTMTITSRPLVG
jgi:hypothetical protein